MASVLSPSPLVHCSPSRCCFSSSGDLFLVATDGGLRATQHTEHYGGGDGAYTTISAMNVPPSSTQEAHHAPQPTSLWHAAVHSVAVAGDSPIVAVLMASPGASGSGGVRHVHLFDASTDTYLAELYFRGAVVHSVQASARLLLVGMVDAFHLIDIRNLHHLRQQSMFKPLNQKGLLAMSQGSFSPAAAAAAGWQEETYRVAYPHSTRGKGEICVVTIRLPELCASEHGQGQPPTTPYTVKLQRESSTAQTGSTGVKEGAAGSQPQQQGPAAAASASADAPSEQSIVLDQEITQSTLMISAHHRPVSALCFNADGRFLATASELGSTVKLFDAAGGGLLKEFQRGRTPAYIYGLALSSNAHMIAALSSTGTLHLFDSEQAAASAGAKSRLLVTDKPRAILKKTLKPFAVNNIQKNARVPSPRDADGDHHHMRPAVALPPPEEGHAYKVHFSRDGSKVWVGQTAVVSTPGGTVGSLQRFDVFRGLRKLSTKADPDEVYELLL